MHKSLSVEVLPANQDLQTVLTNTAKKITLPKLRLKLTDESTSSSDEAATGRGISQNTGSARRSRADRAVDSNRTLVFAYYTRKLLLTGWRSLFRHKIE